MTDVRHLEGVKGVTSNTYAFYRWSNKVRKTMYGSLVVFSNDLMVQCLIIPL